MFDEGSFLSNHPDMLMLNKQLWCVLVILQNKTAMFDFNRRQAVSKETIDQLYNIEFDVDDSSATGGVGGISDAIMDSIAETTWE